MTKICSAQESYNIAKSAINKLREEYLLSISVSIDSCANDGFFECTVNGSKSYRDKLGISDDDIRSLLEPLGYTVEVHTTTVHIYWGNPKTCHSKCDGE